MENFMFTYQHTLRQVLLITLCAMCCSLFASQYGPIRPDETLESIASTYSANTKLSIEQWTVALWNSNSEHFEAQNLYGLHSDVLLTIPEVKDVEKISQTMAEATIKEHAEAWQTLFNFEDVDELANRYNDQHYNIIKPRVIEKPYRQNTSLLSTVSNIFNQSLVNTKSISSNLITKQSIPLFIMSIGTIILLSVFRIAQHASDKDASQNSTMNSTNHPQSQNAFSVVDSEGDYNIFATPEGVNIKLDLAQAYIHMRDLEEAKNILQEIIVNHHGKAVQEAKKLLKQLSDPQKLLESN